jgi:hypothetical protein
MKRALTTIGFLALSIAGPLLSGCSNAGPSFGQTRHTSHIWQTDAEATIGLLAERYPEEADEISGARIDQLAGGVHNVMLELSSDKSYVLHLGTLDDIHESYGTWRHSTTRSGTTVRLSPSPTLPDDDYNRFVRTWVVEIDNSNTRARIKSLSEVDTILTRVE